MLRGIATQGGVPLLLMDHYGKGELYVITVPEEMNDLDSLPAPVLNALRRYLTRIGPSGRGPSQVSLSSTPTALPWWSPISISPRRYASSAASPT